MYIGGSLSLVIEEVPLVLSLGEFLFREERGEVTKA